MERGDTGLGRDAYGLPRRRRFGDRRGRGHRDDAQRAGAKAVRGAEDDDYGQLLRRPGEVPPQEQWRPGGRPRSPQPGRFPPAGQPPGGQPSSGLTSSGFPPSGARPNRPPANGLPPNGGRVGGGRVPGRPYQQPSGRPIPPDADRLYRPQVPGPAEGARGRSGAAQGPDPLGAAGRPGRPPGAPGAPIPGGGPEAYGGAPGTRRGVPGVPTPPEPAGPVIRQREAAVGEERPPGATKSVASIAPDGLESFARDLRTLRAKAELDYPQMAELSHFTMKTLASAAGGLRLPTLPVAVAYVRACGGNVADWEERWQKLAAKITADAAKKRQDEGEEQAPPEPAGPPAIPEPPAAAAQDPSPDPGEVYVITSAKPPRGPGGTGGG